MLIDTMFARDMYQVYEIKDGWLKYIRYESIVFIENNNNQNKNVSE